MPTVNKTIELMSSGQPEPIVITGQIERLVRASGVKAGLVTCSVNGVGAAVFSLEGEEGRMASWGDRLSRLVQETDPEVAGQLRALLYGQDLTLPIERHTLVHEPWQQVVVVDFSPKPQRRLISVVMIGE